MIGLWKVVYQLIAREHAEEAKERARQLHELITIVRSPSDVTVPPQTTRTVFEVARAAVLENLSHPDTATFSADSVHACGDGAFVACGSVESRNMREQTIQNYYLAKVTPDGTGDVCEILDTDPRALAD
jgi:hypothetical protein